MKRDESIYLQHILDAIGKIKQYLIDFNEDRFMKDSRTQDTVVRQLEIIGEATKRLS